MRSDSALNRAVKLGSLFLLTLTTAFVAIQTLTSKVAATAEAELAYSSPLKLSDNEMKTRLAVISTDRALLDEISTLAVLSQRWKLDEEMIATRLAANLAVAIDSEMSTARIRMMDQNAVDAAIVANVAGAVLRDHYDEHDRRRHELVIAMIEQADAVADKAKIVESAELGPKPVSTEGHICRIPPPTAENARAELDAARLRLRALEVEEQSIPRFSIDHIRWAKAGK